MVARTACEKVIAGILKTRHWKTGCVFVFDFEEAQVESRKVSAPARSVRCPVSSSFEKIVFEGQVDEVLGPERQHGAWRVVRVLLKIGRYFVFIPIIVIGVSLFVLPTLAVCIAPLLCPALVWALGSWAGAAVNPHWGMFIGPALFGLLYAAVFARYWKGFLGSGAGWRYWPVIHQEGFPEIGLGYGGTKLTTAPSLFGLALDTAAAALFGLGDPFGAGKGIWVLLVLGIFTLWGFCWGIYLGWTRPRGPHFFMDIAGVLPSNMIPVLVAGKPGDGAPPSFFPERRWRWALGCGLGYGLQASLLGLAALLIAGGLTGN